MVILHYYIIFIGIIVIKIINILLRLITTQWPAIVNMPDHRGNPVSTRIIVMSIEICPLHNQVVSSSLTLSIFLSLSVFLGEHTS